MPNAKRPSGIVPRVFDEDGGGYARPAKCMHCGAPITKGTLRWVKLPGHQDGPSYALHAVCGQAFRRAVRAMSL
jgi:hypothetical protein